MTDMQIMSECGIECITSILVVGVIWGATNPFIRAASVEQEKKNSIEKQSSDGIVASFFKSFLNWRFSVPFALNQSGSILFNILVVNLPITIVVPCVNAIQLISTVIVGRLMGEKMEMGSTRQSVGLLLAVISIIGMLVVDN